MATKPLGANNAPTVTVIICFRCSNRVNQPVGTKRTICPYCGSFFDKRSENGRHASPRNISLPSLYEDKPPNRSPPNDATSRNSPLTPARPDSGRRPRRGLVNFFANLRHKKDSKSAKRRDSAPMGNGSTPGPSSTGTPPCTSLPPLHPGPPGLTTMGGGTSGVQSSRLAPPHVEGSLYKAESQPSLFQPEGKGQNDEEEGGDSFSKSMNNPGKPITLEAIQKMHEVALEDKSYAQITSFFSTVVGSFAQINSVFKENLSRKSAKDHGDPEIKMDLLEAAFDIIAELPSASQRVIVRASVNSLLQKNEKSTDRDELRGFFILLQLPIFEHIYSYVVFAHLLRGIASLTDYDHHFLVNWFRRLTIDKMKVLVSRLHNFLSLRLFPPSGDALPPLNKSSWWIPSAVKVLALLHAANQSHKTKGLPYMEFYNHTLDHLDLPAEYAIWQRPGPRAIGFSFCQYPFVLSIQAKRVILQRDSEQQMLVMARKTLVDKVQKKEVPDISMLFLNLRVRRSHLVTDSLTEISRKQNELKKKLRVTFAGEPGLDMGGLTKEWFLLLIRQIFQTNYGMFSYDDTARVFWFQKGRTTSHQEFHLIGVLMGLAVYNSINLDIRFPPVCYRKLLSPPVVPTNPDIPVGITAITLRDFTDTFPDLGHGFKELLKYEGNVEEDIGCTFQIPYTEPDNKVVYYELKKGGAEIPVTNDNRREYVELYCDFLINRVIYKQFKAFYYGFHSVCASNALIMLRPEEVENLVCGSPEINLLDLSKVVVYDGYTADSPTIKLLWELLPEMSRDLQKLFLHFTTGSDRVPVGGIQEMNFRVTKHENTDMLPMSHTCFNQLILPPYTDKKVLHLKLLIAMENSEGFGIE